VLPFPRKEFSGAHAAVVRHGKHRLQVIGQLRVDLLVFLLSEEILAGLRLFQAGKLGIASAGSTFASTAIANMRFRAERLRLIVAFDFPARWRSLMKMFKRSRVKLHAPERAWRIPQLRRGAQRRASVSLQARQPEVTN